MPRGLLPLDSSKVHEGFGGRPVSWVAAWKTDALAFAEVGEPGGRWAVAYAYTRVYSPEERPAADVPLRFRDFVRYGLLVTPGSLAAALAALALTLP